MLIPLATATENAAQLVQTNVNVQNNVDSSVNAEQPESVTSQIAVQQEVLAVSQDASAVPPSPPSVPSNLPPIDPQTVQLLKEANAQYQYQINSRYEEKTRPVYGEAGQQYNQYSHFPPPAYPYYKENTQYQELGNGQRRAETVINDNVRAQYENQDAYTRQRSQSYSEYGKGEVSPDYNTYSYKRMYY